MPCVARPNSRVEFTKFVMSGLVGFATIELMLWYLLGRGENYFLALVVAFEISVVVNFALNDRFTFSDPGEKRRRWYSRLAFFEGTTMLARAVNFSVYVWAVSALGLNFLLAEALGVGAGFIGNWIAARYGIWRRDSA